MPPKKKEEEVAAFKKGAARFARVKNTLRMGCVGLPNVGKSSTFNLMCGMSVAAENFPFCTIEPSVSRCELVDPRYEKLVDMWKPPSKIPAWLNVTDIAGLVKGASEGAGLGNAFLSHIQAVDGIFHVVRAFENDEIIHVDDSVDPIRDMETITVELCKKDITVYERALQDEETAVKKSQGKMKLSPTYIETMKRVGEYLHAGMPLFGQKWTEGEVQIIREKMKSLITTKPTVYIINLTRKHYEKKKNKWLPKIKEWIDAHGGGPMIPFSVEFEEDFKDMEQAEKDELEKVKVISKLNKMVRAGYDELALQSYFTAGEKEVRAWTVQAGSTAPQAAAVIHEDFQRGFIKAEIAGWSDFDSLQDTKGMDKVKAAGKYRQEGKSYVMQDGDIVHFQFNVTTDKKK